jgi:hypothetical protein
MHCKDWILVDWTHPKPTPGQELLITARGQPQQQKQPHHEVVISNDAKTCAAQSTPRLTKKVVPLSYVRSNIV